MPLPCLRSSRQGDQRTRRRLRGNRIGRQGIFEPLNVSSRIVQPCAAFQTQWFWNALTSLCEVFS